MLGSIFVVMGGVGIAGAVATFFNMKSAFGSSGTAVGVVAAARAQPPCWASPLWA
ncbi:hypothetical protein ACFQ0T_43030 [Kitasatospora gansuensis]